MMADFVDDAVQQLLQQAEERLSAGRIVAKPRASTDNTKTAASTTTTTGRPGGEDANALLPPKQDKTEVRVPRSQVAASQRKGKVRIDHFFCDVSPSFFAFVPGDRWYKDES